MLKRRIHWTYVAGGVLLGAILLLVTHNAPTLHAAFLLMYQAAPGWLGVAVVAIATGFVCAGCIYGRVLATLGYHVRRLWLVAAALVAILISQTIPAGTVGSYAFLTASLHRRGIPATSVAVLAGLELLSWLGAMFVLFSYGVAYMVATSGIGSATTTLSTATSAVIVLSSGLFVGSRSQATLRGWALRTKRVVERLSGSCSASARLVYVVDEIAAHRDLIVRQPRHVFGLICLQLGVFLLHSLALLAILHSLGVSVALPAVLAAYGLSLIAGTFTMLPGGGGTVETALALALSVQGVPLDTAVGTAILFRLLSFWLLLPLGAVCYRFLMARDD